MEFPVFALMLHLKCDSRSQDGLLWCDQYGSVVWHCSQRKSSRGDSAPAADMVSVIMWCQWSIFKWFQVKISLQEGHLHITILKLDYFGLCNWSVLIALSQGRRWSLSHMGEHIKGPRAFGRSTVRWWCTEGVLASPRTTRAPSLHWAWTSEPRLLTELSAALWKWL